MGNYILCYKAIMHTFKRTLWVSINNKNNHKMYTTNNNHIHLYSTKGATEALKYYIFISIICIYNFSSKKYKKSEKIFK